MYAFWAYQNIIAGTNNVSAFYGYNYLLENGATVLYNGTFNHQNCVGNGVGHSASGMLSSQCGLAAMKNATIPAEVAPTDPNTSNTTTTSSSLSSSTSTSTVTHTMSTVTDTVPTTTVTDTASTVTDTTPSSTDTSDDY